MQSGDIAADSKATATKAPGHIAVHPASLLRIPGDGGRKKAFAQFVADLGAAAKLAAAARK